MTERIGHITMCRLNLLVLKNSIGTITMMYEEASAVEELFYFISGVFNLKGSFVGKGRTFICISSPILTKRQTGKNRKTS